MNGALQELTDALKRASRGELVSLDHARSLKCHHPEASIDEFANECWRRLVNFCDDEDIRSRDPAYSNQMKQEMRWRAQALLERLR